MSSGIAEMHRKLVSFGKWDSEWDKLYFFFDTLVFCFPLATNLGHRGFAGNGLFAGVCSPGRNNGRQTI